MLLPKGVAKHQNLSTSFTRFDQLLKDLAENRFSGYVKLNFWEYEGVLVLDTGRIIEGYSSEQGVYLTGENAVLRIFPKAREKDGSIEVYALSSEVALALAYALQSLPYGDENALSNYSLAQVFDRLEREAITGYVDLEFSGNRGQGTVYFMEGIVVESVIMSSTGKIVGGEQVYHKFLQISELVQPTVRVYRVMNPAFIVEDEAFIIPWQHQKYVHFWGEFLQYVNHLMKDRLKKNNFYDNFSELCREVSDHYPFLHPHSGSVHISPRGMEVDSVLHHPAFLQGMAIVLNKMLRQIPPRRFRKLSLEEVARQVQKLARGHDIPENQFKPEKFIAQVFRGIFQ